MKTQRKRWSGNKWWTKSIHCPSLHIQDNWKHHKLCESITHLRDCLRKCAISICRTYWCTDVLKNANDMSYWQKQCSEQQYFGSQLNLNVVHIQIQQHRLALNPQTSSKTIHTHVPSQTQGISMRMHRVMWHLKSCLPCGTGYQKLSLRNMAREECMWHKPTFVRSSHTHATERRTCHSMCTIDLIQLHMHQCANSHNETSPILFINHWFNEICHYKYIPTHHIAFLVP